MKAHGYPEKIAQRLGLADHEVRILAVVRAFEAALGDADPYHPQAEAALIELKRAAGTLFEPAVVGAFLTIYREDAVEQLVTGTARRREWAFA